MNRTIKLTLIAFAIVLMAGCYNDNEEDLYPQTTDCDLSNVTYTATIAPIMATSCNGCHSTASASGGIVTDTYAGLKAIASNGKLYGVVSHASGFSPMPQGGSKLTQCNIDKIKTWVDAGALNN
jgi:cytochrome c5